MRQLIRDCREMLREQLEFRELLLQMTLRDIRIRYKQSLMGFGWAVFMPLVNTAIFSVIFARVAPIDIGVPYPLFAYCGLLSWNFFASSLRFATISLTSNTNLVTKVYFPREAFPFSAICVCCVDFAVGSVVVLGLMIYYGTDVTANLAFLPLVVAVQIMFTAGVALILSMANLFYRDVKYLFEVVITVWMFSTSVLYPVELIGGRLASLLKLNPMTPILEAYRAVLLHGEHPFDLAFGAAAAISAAVLCCAWIVFHRAEFTFAENI